MAINKNRVMEAAQKFVEKGQLDKAIKEYLKVVEEDPRDVRVWLKLGDLHAKKGAKQEATDTYLRVAQFYSDQGFYLKAVAVYKQILRLDPRLIDVNVRLAEVYRQLGLLSDAMQQYELVAAFYHREGKTREALATVRELVEIDPENVATRIKLAELYSKEQMVKEAVAEFAKAADYLRGNNRLDDFIKVAERLVWHQPDNHVMNRELAQLYLRRNDPRHALQKLQVCFKADPRDVDTLALLASAFLALEQRQKTVSVWKELARIHAENNQPALAADVYRRILSVAPDDPDALAGSGGRRAAGSGNQPAVPPQPVVSQNLPVSVPAPVSGIPQGPPRLATPIGSEPSERPMPRLAVPVTTHSGGDTEQNRPVMTLKGPARVATPISGPQVPAPGRGGPAMVARGPASPGMSDGIAVEVDDEHEQTTRSRPDPVTLDVEVRGGRPSEISRLLEQAEVYAKYGLRDKSVGQLMRLIEIDPRNLDARVRLKDNYLALGRPSDAALELVRLVELTATTHRERAEGYLRELAAASPGDPRPEELALRYRLRAPDSSDDLDIEIVQGTAPPNSVTVDSVDVLLEGSQDSPSPDETTDIGADEIISEVEASTEEEGTSVGDEMTFAGEGTMEVDPSELAVEVSDPGDDGVDHELAFDDMTSAPHPDTDHSDRTLDVSAAGLDDLDSLGEEPLELSIDPGDEALAESMGPPSAPPAPGEDNDFERAPQTERPAGLGREPGSAGTTLTSMEDDLDEADFFVSQSLFDEARAILRDLLSRHPNHPLIVAKLRDLPVLDTGDAALASGGAGASKSGARKPSVIARPQGGGADADTHYDLGMAYKEMGLVEEALKEFALARQSPGRAVQSYMMIGLCQLEVGRVSEAVEAFKAGLYVDGIIEQEALALYFELGAAYETLADAREALYYFEKVQKRDPRFRDVEQRIEELKRGGANPAVGRSNGGRTRPPVDEDESGEEEMNAIDSLLDERTPS